MAARSHWREGSPFGIDDKSFGVVVADANGDGKPDLLAGTAASVTVLLGDGRGTIHPGRRVAVPVRVPAHIASASPISTATANSILAAPSFEGNVVTVWLGR